MARVDVACVVRFNAGNGELGNPRRWYVALNPEGTTVGAWDEGYSGSACVPEALRALAARAPTFPSSAQERRETLRTFADVRESERDGVRTYLDVSGAPSALRELVGAIRGIEGIERLESGRNPWCNGPFRAAARILGELDS